MLLVYRSADIGSCVPVCRNRFLCTGLQKQVLVYRSAETGSCVPVCRKRFLIILRLLSLRCAVVGFNIFPARVREVLQHLLLIYQCRALRFHYGG